MSGPSCDNAEKKRARLAQRVALSAETFDIDKLYYPTDIIHIVGLNANQINALKSEGCLFYGRKTTVRWVREHITRQAEKLAGGYSPSPEHPSN